MESITIGIEQNSIPPSNIITKKKHKMQKTLLINIVRKMCSFGLMAILSMTLLTAQETIPSSGGDATGSGGSVSFTVGQTFFSGYSHDAGSVTEGVQQPYEIFIVTSIDEIAGIELEMSAYPNPVNDILNLKVEESYSEGLSWQLYNLSGALLDSGSITSSITGINMQEKVASVYFLRVIKNNMEIKTFKIIKNR